MHQIIRKAFTLIELLVVIAIIGILSGLIVVSMGGMTQKATIAKAQVFSNSLRNSLMLNLVSEWKLDGNVNDSWSGGNNGTWVGPLAPNTTANYRPESECVSNQCLSFDGVDDRVDIAFVPGITVTENYTIGAWFNKKSTGNGTLINISNLAANRHGVYFSAHKVGCGLYDGIAYNRIISLADVPLNAWHYITCVKTGSVFSLYFDGLIIPIETGGMGLGGSQNRMGYNSNDGGYLNSFIDEVRIFNAVIPISQIKEQYYAGLNKLLASGQVSTREYQDNILKLSQYSANK